MKKTIIYTINDILERLAKENGVDVGCCSLFCGDIYISGGGKLDDDDYLFEVIAEEKQPVGKSS